MLYYTEKEGDSVSFKFYKFCQNGLITFCSAAFAMFYSLAISGGMSWWLGLIISVAATIAGFIPPFGMLYPLTFGIFLLVALIRSYIYSSAFFWLLLVLLIVHVIRFVAMLTFARANPQKSLQYDEAIRYGIEIE